MLRQQGLNAIGTDIIMYFKRKIAKMIRRDVQFFNSRLLARLFAIICMIVLISSSLTKGKDTMTFIIHSPAFNNGESNPKRIYRRGRGYLARVIMVRRAG